MVGSGTTSGARKGEAVIRPPARVLLADDRAVVRERLRAVLEAEGGIEVVGETKDGQEALGACRQLCPDVVLMAMRLLERLAGREGVGSSERPGENVEVEATPPLRLPGGDNAAGGGGAPESSTRLDVFSAYSQKRLLNCLVRDRTVVDSEWVGARGST